MIFLGKEPLKQFDIGVKQLAPGDPGVNSACQQKTSAFCYLQTELG